MNLHKPFEIGSRLLPSLHVGDGWLSLDAVGCKDNRMVYRWYVDIPAGEFSETDLESPYLRKGDAANDQEAFGSLLAFLIAVADGLDYETRTGRESENTDLFPRPVVEWAQQHSNELESLREDIEETKNLLED